ncbi:hypothetical protein JCM21900_003042 [Sporobolomyces salmonicolor]
MSSRLRKRQRTTSTTADETPRSTPSTAGLKARVSRGDDAADLKSLLHTISTCRLGRAWGSWRVARSSNSSLWCACNGHPFGITDNDKLPCLLNEVARRHCPSASASSVAVNDLSDFCAAEVRSLLDRTYGAIYLALDAWTAPNGIEVLGVLAFFKTKAGSTELLEHVVPLDFIALVNTHLGEYLARVVRELCEEYGILNKVMGIASDNASNMGRMMEELSEYGLGKDKWVRCWAHILNLVVTTIFAYFDSTTESKLADPRPESEGKDPAVEDQHLSLNTRVVWFSNDDTAKEDTTSQKRRSTAGPRGRRQAPTAIPGARLNGQSTRYAQKLAEQCRYNRTICMALFTLSNSSTPRPPHPQSTYPAVKTPWNSQTRQFRQIVSHRAQIEKIQTDPKYNIKKENRLNRGDFRLLSDLLKVLEPFEDLTVAFSTWAGGQIEGVLPMIDLLVRHLKGFLNDPNTVPALHNAIILGLEKLFDYYGKTTTARLATAPTTLQPSCTLMLTWLLVTVLHPAGSTRYLKPQNWPQVWIDDAIEATQALYNMRHLDKACAAQTKARDHRASSSTTTKSIFELLDEDDEDDLDLDLYNIVRNFATAKRTRVNAAGQPISALDYWKRQYAAGEMNEGLMELTLDIFGCPASSVDVERAFSFGGFTVSDRRHSLSEGTLTNCMFVAACDKHGLVRPGMLREGREQRAEGKRKKGAELFLEDSESDLYSDGDVVVVY